MVALQSEEIRPDELVARVGGSADGAVALFLGTVRDHNQGRRVLYLEYHAYAEMAESEMQALERQALERFEISRVELVHRTGRLEIGDDGRSLTQAAIPRLMNGFDEQALEAALRIADAGLRLTSDRAYRLTHKLRMCKVNHDLPCGRPLHTKNYATRLKKL